MSLKRGEDGQDERRRQTGAVSNTGANTGESRAGIRPQGRSLINHNFVILLQHKLWPQVMPSIPPYSGIQIIHLMPWFYHFLPNLTWIWLLQL